MKHLILIASIFVLNGSKAFAQGIKESGGITGNVIILYDLDGLILSPEVFKSLKIRTKDATTQYTTKKCQAVNSTQCRDTVYVIKDFNSEYELNGKILPVADAHKQLEQITEANIRTIKYIRCKSSGKKINGRIVITTH